MNVQPLNSIYQRYDTPPVHQAVAPREKHAAVESQKNTAYTLSYLTSLFKNYTSNEVLLALLLSARSHALAPSTPQRAISYTTQYHDLYSYISDYALKQAMWKLNQDYVPHVEVVATYDAFRSDTRINQGVLNIIG